MAALKPPTIASLRRNARSFWKYISSKRVIPVLKGTIAYLIAIILVFLRPFDAFLKNIPAAYTAMFIVVIAGTPGKTVGACLQALGFALVGIGLGAVGFVVLAELGNVPVAQGFVLAVFVYFMALLKARGIRWFGLSLLAILMAFNGIYTARLYRTRFHPGYLQDYLIAYCWGGAIVMGVNLLVLPRTSERALRETLVASLEHVATLSHLLAKAYRLELSDEERAVRERLVQTVRADFGFLQQSIGETSIEINYSQFSMKDYRSFVAQLRVMQQCLITAHSSLSLMEDKDRDFFQENFLQGTSQSFCRLRRAIDLVIRDIGENLGCGKPMVISATQAGYKEFMDQDLEKQVQREHVQQRLEKERNKEDMELERPDGTGGASVEYDLDGEDVDIRLNEVARRLAKEVEQYDLDTSTPAEPGVHFTSPVAGGEAGTPFHPSGGTSTLPVHPSLSQTGASTPGGIPTASDSSPHLGDTGAASTEEYKGRNIFFSGRRARRNGGLSRIGTRMQECGIDKLERLYDDFCETQHDIFTRVLVEGLLHEGDDTLRLYAPQPSLHTIFGPDLPETREGDDYVPRVPATGNGQESGSEKKFRDSVNPENVEKAVVSHHSLLRVYSFIFAMGKFTQALEKLWDDSQKKPRSIHIHLYETLHRPHAGTDAEAERELSLNEALALLEGRKYTPVKKSIWQKLDEMEHLLRHPRSIFAMKTAAAAVTFALLILVESPSQWFINYGLSAGLLTVVVALAPTLGQSIFTFILQIAGSGIGFIYALVVLEIFKGVGGYTYNPYGITCLLIPYAFGMCYLLYEKPVAFIVSLLGLNATAILCATEWIYTEHLRLPFDKPPLRAAKGLVALFVALAIVAVFQLFVLRNPARRTLRKKTGDVINQVLSLVTLLQAYVRATIPADPQLRADHAALRRVEKELRHRELKIQADIIGLAPLMQFAASEPQYSRPLQTESFNKIIRTTQVILDRIREARTALGTEPLDDYFLENFVAKLSTYRRINSRLIKNSLYLVATSLMSKTPMPHETLSGFTRAQDFLHDALVISSRFARESKGAKAIRSGSFLRYWAFVMCMINLSDQLPALEGATKDLIGELESKLL